VEEALKAKRQRVKERTDSSRKAPTAPHRPEVPERWQPVERMIRAHASQAFIARENLQAVITETIAALNEIENVTDADVSALCKDDPIDRADGRVQLWPPESFARALDVLVQARLGAEARAAEDVPPWM
jgi:hypothetical protein